jgi:hypothetical protein
MLYELREYLAVDGAMDRLQTRFARHTLRLLEKHGIDVVGFWADNEDRNRLVYLIRYGDAPSRDRAWASFRQDPEWPEVRAASEADGPIVEKMTIRTLSSPDYWPHLTARG